MFNGERYFITKEVECPDCGGDGPRPAIAFECECRGSGIKLIQEDVTELIGWLKDKKLTEDWTRAS